MNLRHAEVVRARVVVGSLAVVAVVAAIAWFVAVPRWRPALGRGERLGIDVSNHQGEIDWARVAADGIDFAYLKSSEGRDFVDRRFMRNWDGDY